MSEATRRKIYDMLVADKCGCRASTDPFPGPGWVREGWHRAPACAGAVEPGDLTRLVNSGARAIANRDPRDSGSGAGAPPGMTIERLDDGTAGPYSPRP